jgi:hypothetical protein
LLVYVLIFSGMGMFIMLLIGYEEWRDGIDAKRKQRHAKRASYYSHH